MRYWGGMTAFYGLEQPLPGIMGTPSSECTVHWFPRASLPTCVPQHLAAGQLGVRLMWVTRVIPCFWATFSVRVCIPCFAPLCVLRLIRYSTLHRGPVGCLGLRLARNDFECRVSSFGVPYPGTIVLWCTCFWYVYRWIVIEVCLRLVLLHAGHDLGPPGAKMVGADLRPLRS